MISTTWPRGRRSYPIRHIVYGTPGGDTIAGGGHHGQIIYAGAGNDTINGTGKSDLIYAGSGNDTVKGNDGDDTIYGGSGSDTINGNNGCDTIIGGYGADKLTGSNGDDRFVYLSAADSNAARFDVISDFRSGSDRIDLTALGALAFLALTSTSTSVPAHTVAWLYDSTTNETIVYVNPTDHTLILAIPPCWKSICRDLPPFSLRISSPRRRQRPSWSPANPSILSYGNGGNRRDDRHDGRRRFVRLDRQ